MCITISTPITRHVMVLSKALDARRLIVASTLAELGAFLPYYAASSKPCSATSLRRRDPGGRGSNLSRDFCASPCDPSNCRRCYDQRQYAEGRRRSLSSLTDNDG